jgi:crossover junction endodeoxyribonuclease RusA
MIVLDLPFPAKVLWPNGRGHWAAKARATKSARRMAWTLALEALSGAKPDWQKVSLSWVIHPKTANRLDDDGPPAALKAFRDGIADALGIDDANFQASYAISGPIRGGLVSVTITPIGA